MAEIFEQISTSYVFLGRPGTGRVSVSHLERGKETIFFRICIYLCLFILASLTTDHSYLF